jgi:hypothetical protein
MLSCDIADSDLMKETLPVGYHGVHMLGTTTKSYLTVTCSPEEDANTNSQRFRKSRIPCVAFFHYESHISTDNSILSKPHILAE